MKNKNLNEILKEINNQAIELEQDSGVDEFTEYIKGMRYVLNEIKWFINESYNKGLDQGYQEALQEFSKKD